MCKPEGCVVLGMLGMLGMQEKLCFPLPRSVYEE